MADDVAAKAGSFLTRKVGPAPVWVWMAIGGGFYVYFSRKQAAAKAQTATNQQTDPAGNIGSIDPATGYVYGTPEDLAALAANNAGTSSGGGSGTAGQNSTSGGQTYADNNSWGIAAVNFLVGLGVDATTANQAVELYLSSQPLTTAQQADVNLAIAKLGPPPTLPGPVQGNPPPVTTPPGGGTPPPGGKPPGKTAPVPTGLVVTAKHATSATIKWQASQGATGYEIAVTDASGKKVQGYGTKSLVDTIGGLKPSTTYNVRVVAEPSSGPGGPAATLSFTTPKSG